MPCVPASALLARPPTPPPTHPPPKSVLNWCRQYYDYMRSYSPIDNVRTNATYPAMLIVSGLNDPRVAYWEPTKWAQVRSEGATQGARAQWERRRAPVPN